MNKLVSKYYPQFLLIILAFAFFTRFYRLHIPEKYIFDEVYHAVTAKLIANNDPRAYEWSNPPPEPNTAVDWLHPPLAKYTQALSMKMFEQNSFGWRFSSAIFGVLAIFLTARLAFNLFKNKSISLLAAAIASLDGLLLTMSRIAMNDIHVTVFILMTLNFYTIYLNSKRKDRRYFELAGMSAGLAIGTKWSGVFAIMILGLFELVNLIKIFFHKINKKVLLKKTQKFIYESLRIFIVLIAMPAMIYVLSYSHMFLQGKDLNHLYEMHKNTWWYQTTLEATHPASSRPIEWFLNTKPVWINVEWKNNTRADIYAVGNPMIFWVGDIFVIMTFIYLIYKRIKNQRKINTNLFLLFFAYFAVWLPWQLSPRIMFFYHYLPAVPLLCIITAFWLNKLFESNKGLRFLAILILALFFITFIVWYPHWTGLYVSEDIKDKLYFAFDSWKQK